MYTVYVKWGYYESWYFCRLGFDDYLQKVITREYIPHSITKTRKGLHIHLDTLYDAEYIAKRYREHNIRESYILRRSRRLDKHEDEKYITHRYRNAPSERFTTP